MKHFRFTSIFILLFLSLTCYAEEIKIKSFTATIDPMTVPMQRKDMNGEICALVKVILPSDQAVFEGNLVGDWEYKTSEYWCYLAPGSNTLIINYPGYKLLKVNFDSLIGSKLESKRVYELVLSLPEKGDSEKENTINGYEYVDLGLRSGLKWATCNIGSLYPSDYGDCFAWGETTTKDQYNESNSLTYGKKFKDIKGEEDFDAARANWKSSWRLPTKAEWEELIKSCIWTWETLDNHEGYKVTGPNGNYIFLPAEKGHGGFGYYWSSTPKDSKGSYELNFEKNNRSLRMDFYNNRWRGHRVRPVSK